MQGGSVSKMADELTVPNTNGLKRRPSITERPSPLFIPTLTPSEKPAELKLPRLAATVIPNRGPPGRMAKTTPPLDGAITAATSSGKLTGLLIRPESPEGGCSYEATCLVTLLNDMLTGVNVVAFLDQSARSLDIAMAADAAGSVTRKLEPIAPLLSMLQEHVRAPRGALLSERMTGHHGRVQQTVRHVVRFGRQLWRADLEFRVMVLVKSNKSLRLSSLGAVFREYIYWLDSHLKVDAILDDQRATKLRRARHLTARHELAIAELRIQISDVEKVADSEIRKKEAKIEKLRAYKEEIVTAIAQLTDQARKESQWRVRTNDVRSTRLGAQMNFQMEQLKFRLNVLEHVNDETESRLRKERKEVIELVSKCLSQKDSSLRQKKELTVSVDSEFQKEQDSLNSLKTRIQEVEDEFKKIVLHRENQVKQHRERVQKVKKQFQAVVRIHSLFTKSIKKQEEPPQVASPAVSTGLAKGGKKGLTKKKGKSKAHSANQ